MDRNGHNFRLTEQENGHPSEDDLLLYSDRELNREEGVSIQSHLGACWSCRARIEKYEETIRSFVDYRETVQKPMDEAPPSGWRKFNDRLEALVIERGQQSALTRMRGWLGIFRPSLPNFSLSSQFAGRVAAIIAITAVVIGLVFIRSNHIPVVSASELLQHASDAQSASVRATTQPVIHQRLRIRTGSQSVTWEVWNDVQGARFHSSLANQTSTPSLSVDIVNVLARVLQANQMDPQRPLSASSYQTWRETLAQKQEEVVKTRLSNGVDALTLHTVPTTTVSEGQIQEAVFSVRASDWHPVEQKLTVKSTNGTEVYELLETESEVVSLNQLSPAIFGNAPAVVAKAETKPSPSLSPKASTEPGALLPGVVASAATADLEVEVLRLLHDAGADLGEQINVNRTSNGAVRVTGIVETDQRKKEIVAALISVAGNPAVEIDVETVAEAVSKQKQKSSTSPHAFTSEGVEIQGRNIPAEPQLRAYFEQRSSDIDGAVRQFAADMVAQSRQAMQHLGAMKRLVNQFSDDRLEALTPDARSKLLGLLRDHAHAYQEQSALLRRKLKPVFFAGASEDLPPGPVISSDRELKRFVQELFALAAANDQVIRSAFTVTSETARFTAINSPQFWQSMTKTEALAAAISRQLRS